MQKSISHLEFIYCNSRFHSPAANEQTNIFFLLFGNYITFINLALDLIQFRMAFISPAPTQYNNEIISIELKTLDFISTVHIYFMCARGCIISPWPFQPAANRTNTGWHNG